MQLINNYQFDKKQKGRREGDGKASVLITEITDVRYDTDKWWWLDTRAQKVDKNGEEKT